MLMFWVGLLCGIAISAFILCCVLLWASWPAIKESR
jgi:hypothetical protein